jgi:transcription elongation factor GreA
MEWHPISREGYNKIREEIRQLEEEEMMKVAERIKQAREEGDLSENAEYHGQREQLAHLERKAQQLKSKLANCEIVDKSTMPKGMITFGSTITVRDLDDDEEERYEFVGPGEEDYTGEVMKILTTSPLASRLIGKKVDDTVNIEIPSGLRRLQVVEIVDH